MFISEQKLGNVAETIEQKLSLTMGVSKCKHHTFVCLFETLSQSVLTTVGSGLHGPQGPVSTFTGDWGLIFIG